MDFQLSERVTFGYSKVCNSTMEISRDGLSAHKKNPSECYAYGVVYGERPLTGAAEFELEIVRCYSGWSGTIKIGVMKVPEDKKLTDIDVPRYSSDAPGYCVWCVDKLHNNLNSSKAKVETPYGRANIDTLSEGSRVGLKLNENGDLSFLINGNSQGVALKSIISKGHKLFVVVDHYARCVATRITRSVEQNVLQTGVKEMKISKQQNNQPIQQIQQVVSELRATVSAEQQKTASLEKRFQELESKNNSLESQTQALTLQNQSLQTTLTSEQHKSEKVISGLLDRIKTLEDTVERLWAIPRDEIKLSNNILGTGGWGYVNEATFRGRRVAAKCLHEAIVSPHNQDLFAKEMKISARCRHKNLVEFIGAVPDHPAIIVIEMMDCTLRWALTNGRATPNHIHPICIDVAQGLVYLHGIQPSPIIHRDVSAPNVLLKAVATGWIAKLSDLGSAQFANIAQTLVPGCVLYAAPEVQQRDSARHQTVKMDVFSFGVLLIEILTREMPTSTIAELVTTIRPLWPRFVPLIQHCTNSNPNNRPTMREVITTLNTIVM